MKKETKRKKWKVNQLIKFMKFHSKIQFWINDAIKKEIYSTISNIKLY